MAAHSIEMISPNTYIGTIADMSRENIVRSSKRTDSQRLLWVRYLLPTFMKKEFIDSVLSSESQKIGFSVDLPVNDATSLGLLDAHLTFKHLALFQNFTELDNKSVSVSLLPWQLRVVFHPEARSDFCGISLDLVHELKAIFKTNGWIFSLHDDGFVIMSSLLYDNLKSISDIFLIWEDTHTKKLTDVHPLGEKVFDGLNWPGVFGYGKGFGV